MKAIVFFSGGVSSYLAAKRACNKYKPERYKYHADREAEAIASGINHTGVIRVMRNNKTQYITLHDYAKTIERGLFEEYDTRGCGCFSDV